MDLRRENFLERGLVKLARLTRAILPIQEEILLYEPVAYFTLSISLFTNPSTESIPNHS